MLLCFHCITYQIAPTHTLRPFPNPSYHHHRLHRLSTLFLPLKPYRRFPRPILSSSFSVSTETTASDISEEGEGNDNDFLREKETVSLNLDDSLELGELKRFQSPIVEVKELEELPEQWRRSRLAWLCKELPAHRSATFIRVLNAQRKWIRQDDCTYIAIHCMRIRENESAFRFFQEGKKKRSHTIFHRFLQQGRETTPPHNLIMTPHQFLRSRTTKRRITS